MAAVEVTISGMLYDKLARTTQNVVLIGEASLTGLSVGGGPIIPPGGGGSQPPIIWGPPGPWPSPPIAGIPGIPGYNPPPGGGSGGGSGGGGTLPGHPISGGVMGVYALFWSPATGAVWVPIPTSSGTPPTEPPVEPPSSGTGEPPVVP